MQKTIVILWIFIGIVLAAASDSQAGDVIMSTPIPTPITDDMIWIEDVSGDTGQEIEVIAMVSNPDTPLDAFGFYLEHACPDMLDYVSCDRGNLDPGWVMFGCNEPTVGEIRATGFVAPGSLPPGCTGSLVKFTFLVTCESCEYGDQCDLILTNLADDLTGWGIGNATFTFTGGSSTPVPDVPAAGTAGTLLLILGLSAVLVSKKLF